MTKRRACDDVGLAHLMARVQNGEFDDLPRCEVVAQEAKPDVGCTDVGKSHTPDPVRDRDGFAHFMAQRQSGRIALGEVVT